MKPPRKPTPESLKRSAVAYLERYAASRAMLRAVLMRRVARWARLTGAGARAEAGAEAEAEAETGAEAIAALSDAVDDAVAAAARAGLVDDARFAAGRTATLARRGWPARRIRAALGQKGLDGDTVSAALEAAEIDDAAAARRFAQRRRLGPWRTGDDRAERREKDIAALMRAGFSLALAREAVDGAAVDGEASDGTATDGEAED